MRQSWRRLAGAAAWSAGVAWIGLLAGASVPGPARAEDRPKRLLIADERGESPVELYDQGIAFLEDGDEKNAEEAFRRCQNLARKSGIDFAPPHEGMARLLLGRGKLVEAGLEADHAVELDPNWAPAFWVLGRIAEAEKNDELALVHYQRGLIADPNSPELRNAAVDLLRRAGREREAAELEEAARKPKRTVARKSAPAPADGATAASPLELARRRLEFFFPGQATRLPDPLVAALAGPLLTRGALAVLATGDGGHSLARGLESSMADVEGFHRTPVDVKGRPEEAWIEKALALGIMENLPDGQFHPDGPISRQALALWVEETIARLRHSDEIFRLYRGRPSPFLDLPAGHYACNAARVAVDLDLLAPRPDGRFGPDEPVSMEEGITAISRLVPAMAGRRDE